MLKKSDTHDIGIPLISIFPFIISLENMQCLEEYLHNKSPYLSGYEFTKYLKLLTNCIRIRHSS